MTNETENVSLAAIVARIEKDMISVLGSTEPHTSGLKNECLKFLTEIVRYRNALIKAARAAEVIAKGAKK